MRELNLDQLRTLLAVADLGTFSAAARALHLAQPTVSLHITELEARLDARLLVRGHRRVEPTAAGLALIERGRRLLREADDAVEAVRRQARGLAGRVRVGSSTGVVVSLLPQVLQALHAEHEGIEVEVSILGSAEALARVAAGTLDIGVVALPQPPQAGIRIAPWRTQPVMAYLPQRWQAPARVTPEWLAQQPLIFNDPGTHLYRLTMAWFAAAGQSPRARIELNYDAAIQSLVAAGYGAALLPSQLEDGAALPAGIQMRPPSPRITRRLGIAHRARGVDGATGHVIELLNRFRRKRTGIGTGIGPVA